MRISDWSSDVCSSDLLPYVVNRIPHPRHAVEGSKITIESVSKASERLWFRLHTAPWFKPFRSAGVLLLGKTTQGLFAIVSTALAARPLGLEAFSAVVLLHGFIMAVAGPAGFQSWPHGPRYGAPALHARPTAPSPLLPDFSATLNPPRPGT